MEQKLEFQKNIRSHWGFENKLLWTLDVSFSEDTSRKRNKNAAQNYSVLLKTALNLLKNEKTEKQGIACKRLKAGWNENYLLKVLNVKVCVCPIYYSTNIVCVFFILYICSP